jgi:hypothetical protein
LGGPARLGCLGEASPSAFAAPLPLRRHVLDRRAHGPAQRVREHRFAVVGEQPLDVLLPLAARIAHGPPLGRQQCFTAAGGLGLGLRTADLDVFAVNEDGGGAAST